MAEKKETTALHVRLLGLLRPYMKYVYLSLFLTVFYVVFNSVSLWVSVDFIQVIFDPQTVESVRSPGSEPAMSPEGDSGSLLDLTGKTGIYNRINQALKKLIIREDPYDTLKVICLLIFLSFLLKNLFAFLRRVTINYIQLNIVLTLRNRLYHALMHAPLSYFHRHDSGRLTSIAFNDVNSVHNVLSDSLHKMILSPLQIIFHLVMLISISPKLSLITLTIIPVSAYLIVKIGQSMRRKSRRVLRQISNVMSIFKDSITGVRIVKAFTAEDREEEKFQEQNLRFFRVNFRANKLRYATSPINETLGAFILVALLWYGGKMVYGQSGLEAEHFIRFLVFLFTMFQPMRDLYGINNTIQIALAASERIFDVIDETPEIYTFPGARRLDSFDRDIEMRKVSFRYGADEPWVLRDVDLLVRKSETVALVGPSGAGKSTLMNLIPRFYELEEGNIFIDGTSIDRFDLRSLRNRIGIVTQDVILFNDSIRANIAYGLETASEDQIIHAAKVANAWEFIEKMEGRLDSLVGEGGGRLSGGQKQRLSIARAVLKNPPILILDEATSSLDTESEQLVQEAIEELMRNRTVFVIAHRLSTVLHSDSIVVMNAGRIEDAGPHERLLQSCELYRRLYEIQFSDEKISGGL